MKPLIGIISYRKADAKDTPFLNSTSFSKVVGKRIIDAGGIPVGIHFPDGIFREDIIKLVDGLVFQGGSFIEMCKVDALEYAYKNSIPTLGICNGMQTMGGYDYKTQTNKKTVNELEYLCETKDHNKINGFHMSDLETVKHKVILDKNSRLYNIYKKEIIYGASLHNCIIKKEVLDNSKLFKAVGYSEDGVLEAIEAVDKNKFMFGVQYHIELEDDHSILFKELINESKKYKK